MATKKSGRVGVAPESAVKRATGATTRKHAAAGEQSRVGAGGASPSKGAAGRASAAAKLRKKPTRTVSDKHPARPGKKVDGPPKDALVMPVTAPQRDLLRQIDLLINQGSEVMLVQAKYSVQLTGDTLAALRQFVAALNAGPLSLLIGDSRDTELTSQEAADLLNVSRPYVVKLAREGKLPHVRVGNRHRFLLSEIQEYNQHQRLVREQALAAMSPEGGYSDEDF